LSSNPSQNETGTEDFPNRCGHISDICSLHDLKSGFHFGMGVRCLGITLGDPGGIGPEVALKAVYESTAAFVPVIFGPISVMDYLPMLAAQFHIHFLATPKNEYEIEDKFKGLRPLDPTSEKNGIQPFERPLRQAQCNAQGPAEPFEKASFSFFPAEPGKKKTLFWVNTGGTPFHIGEVSPDNGLHAYEAIRLAAAACLAGYLDGMVTAPICKEAMAMAGAPLTDHTTLLASLSKSDVSMGFYSVPLRVVLVTVHCALSDVSARMTPESIRRACAHAVMLATYHRDKSPKATPMRIAVAGLNPHAGENGLFGHEERDVITPTLAALRDEGLPVEGPFPADTLFHYAYKGDYDVVVAMYHDQGLIPVKMLAFDTAVNVTIGLPFVRTSPDHGTAFSLAYQDKADYRSFAEALDVACHWRVA